MAMQWILTWARTAFSRKNIPPPVEHAAFDSQTEAVNFAMSLDYPQRRTVRLHLPGGDIAELAVIEQMYAHSKGQIKARDRASRRALQRKPATLGVAGGGGAWLPRALGRRRTSRSSRFAKR